jgi:hypothetical protein
MKELDDFLRQQTDLSNMKASIASAEKAAPKDLQSQVDAAHRAQMERLRDYAKAHPNDPLVKANQHLLPAADGPKTPVIGNCAMTSFIWWALGGRLTFFQEPSQPSFSLHGRGGPNWAAATFSAPAIGGNFLVSPYEVKNSSQCNFSLFEGGIGMAALVIQLWSTSGTFWATVGGPAPGIGAASVSGTLQITWGA